MQYLLISHIIRVRGCGFLHSNQGEHLEQMILHYITDEEREKVKRFQTTCKYLIQIDQKYEKVMTKCIQISIHAASMPCITLHRIHLPDATYNLR